MRKFLLFFLLFLPSLAYAQTAVTGHVRGGSGSAVTSSTFVRFRLRNYAGAVPRVTGVGTIVQPQFDVTPNGSGVISTNIYGNDVIDPAATFWTVEFWYNGKFFASYNYLITGSSTFNLDSAVPINTTVQANSSNLLGSRSYTFQQTTPATTWTITHNFADPNVLIECFDNNSKYLIPDTVVRTDLNNTTVTFLSAQSGSCTVLNGNSQVLTSNIGNAVVTNPTGGQTIIGTFPLNIPVLVAANQSKIIYVDGVTYSQSDIGAGINAAETACDPSLGCKIVVPSGNYSTSTAVSITKNTAIECPSGSATSANSAQINWVPATGTLLTVTGAAFQMSGCWLNTSTSTTSHALDLAHASEVHIYNNHIFGFHGSIHSTWDGANKSTGIHIDNNLIDGFTGSGSYGISIDNSADIFLNSNRVYSVTNSTTSTPLLIDSNTDGLWIDGGTYEQGVNPCRVQKTLGGLSPAAIFIRSITCDNSQGGDNLLFDATLGTDDIQFFCTECWTKNSVAGNGININGGSNIHFRGGINGGNYAWGTRVNSAGTDFSFVDVTSMGNNTNVSNPAGIGGYLITANPTHWRIIGGRTGGGQQKYGIDWSAASSTGYFLGTDLSSNATGRSKNPATITAQGVDLPDYGGLGGSQFLGGVTFVGGPTPVGVAGSVVCSSDNTASYVLQCSVNGDTAKPVARTSGALTNGNLTQFDSSGRIVDSGLASASIGGSFTCVNVTPVTVNTNTSSDQNLMSCTITANTLNTVKKTILVQSAAVYSTPAASTTTVNIKLKLCTVSGCGSGTVVTLASWTSAALGVIQATNDPLNATLNFTTQTAGGSAAFESHGNLTIDISALTTAAEAIYADNNTATVGTIDSTAQLFLQETVSFGTASGSNSMTQRQLVVDSVD